jgi:hypothetical protein
MSTWLNRGASGGLAGASRNLKFVQSENRHLAVIGGRVLTGAHRRRRIRPQLTEDPLDHLLLEDRRDDPELAAAAVVQRERGILR